MCAAASNNYLGNLIPLRSKTYYRLLPSRDFLILRRKRLHVNKSLSNQLQILQCRQHSRDGLRAQTSHWPGEQGRGSSAASPLRTAGPWGRVTGSEGWVLDRACQETTKDCQLLMTAALCNRLLELREVQQGLLSCSLLYISQEEVYFWYPGFC